MKKGNRKKKANIGSVCVVGLGYVGLTLSLALAEKGVKVFGVDVSKLVIATLNKKKSHVHEPGINKLLNKHVNKQLFLSTSIPQGEKIQFFIISVGTSLKTKTSVDYGPLTQALEEVGQTITKGSVVLLRSTVTLGTSNDIVIPTLENVSSMKVGKDFSVVFAPERTIEGDAINELYTLPQVYAASDQTGARKTKRLFGLLNSKMIELHSLEEAEMVKLMSNAYRDLTFAFANEMSRIADHYNIDINRTISASNQRYSRNNIPLPSPGVGGYCLTKDPLLLSASAAKHGKPSRLLIEGRLVNDGMIGHVVKICENHFAKARRKNMKPVITLLGLAFKGNPPTSDIRFSPSVALLRELIKKDKYTLRVHDPLVKEEAVSQYRNIVFCDNLETAFLDADIVILMTNHPQYSNMSITRLTPLMKRGGFLFDTWGLHQAKYARDESKVYMGNLSYQSFVGQQHGRPE